MRFESRAWTLSVLASLCLLWLIGCGDEPADPPKDTPELEEEINQEDIPLDQERDDMEDLEETNDLQGLDQQEVDQGDASEDSEEDSFDPNLPEHLEGRWEAVFGEENLALTFSAEGLVRVQRFGDSGPPIDRGWTSTEAWSWPEGALSPRSEGDRWIFETQRWRLEIDRATGLLTLLQGAHTIYSERASLTTPTTLKLALEGEDHFLGLGEKIGGIDKRGARWTMWNTDALSPDPGVEVWSDPLYQSHPFLLVVREGRSLGIYLQTTARSIFDLGATADEVEISAESVGLDYVLIPGPTIPEVIERYTSLVGRTYLPPLWTLGYHQCRWSYAPESAVRAVTDELRSRDISADGIWLDIDYMDGFRSFTWSPTGFPQPSALLSDLEANGFKTTVIIDPGIKEDPGYEVYESGMSGGHFVTNPSGEVYVGEVWPGASVFPDFTSSAARDWWAGLVPTLTEVGVRGIWIDMNEPTTFTGPFPVETRFDGEGHEIDHREARNYYAKGMAIATMRGLIETAPERRPFILTRAGFAGISSYAAVWTGDAESSWDGLKMVPMMLSNMGLSGIPFAGSDVGGFMGEPGQELFVRWMAVGSASPFFRGHVQTGMPGHEPWAFGSANLSRPLIDVRYELLPTFYSLMRDAMESGQPLVRPLVYRWPDSTLSWSQEHVWLVGEHLMVVPALAPGITEVSVEVPGGIWIDRHSGQRLSPGSPQSLAAPLNRLPMLARANAPIITWPRLRWVGERSPEALYIDLYPDLEAPGASAEIYLDDGETMAWSSGDDWRREVRTEIEERTLVVHLDAAEGGFSPNHDKTSLRLHFVAPPDGEIILDGEALMETEAGLEGAQGFHYDATAQTLFVWLTRDADAHRVEVPLGAPPTTTPEVWVKVDIFLPEETPASEPIYLATNLSGWTPDAVEAVRLSSGHAHATFSAPVNAEVQFKVTRGSWESVQKYSDCSETPNEVLTASPNFDNTLRHRHQVWRFADDCP